MLPASDVSASVVDPGQLDVTGGVDLAHRAGSIAVRMVVAVVVPPSPGIPHGCRVFEAEPESKRHLIQGQDAVGDEPRESYDWDHENDVSTYYTDGRTVGGVCAVGIDAQYDDEIDQNVQVALDKVAIYSGNRIALVRADGCDYGEDAGEWILKGCPEVAGVWEVSQ